MQAIELLGIDIENIRGFTKASFPLDNDLAIFVGANNAGKTSLFIILKWIFNHNISLFKPGESSPLAEDDKRSLRPARNVRNKASRISLRIKISDGRRRRKFSPDSSGIVNLRFNFRRSNNRYYISVGRPKKGEQPQHQDKAIELLSYIYDIYSFVYISPNRISDGIFFEYSLTELQHAFRERPGQKSKERKSFLSGIEGLNKSTRAVSGTMIKLIKKMIPHGYISELSILYDMDKDDLISWIANRIKVKISTGSHDKDYVFLNEVGTGLLALITLLLEGSGFSAGDNRRIIAIEEPEAFLHPPAQRTLAQHLFQRDAEVPRKPIMLISTHSPIIVEESNYCNMYIVSSHKVFQPTCPEKDRAEINSAFLSGHGAEMLFYKNILFVEGEADFRFFYTLFRRLAPYDKTGSVNDIKVVPVGGNERFAPWIKLLSSYARPQTESPYNFLVLADGDSANEIKRAAKDSNLDIADKLSALLNNISLSYNYFCESISAQEAPPMQGEQLKSWIRHCEEFNQAARKSNFPLRLLHVDLEYVITERLDDGLTRNLCTILDIDSSECNVNKILKKMGSKTAGCKSGGAEKGPWVRQKISEMLSNASLEGHLGDIVVDILTTYGIERRKARRMIQQLS